MTLNSWPVSFRVIGFGGSIADLIKEVQMIGYDGLQADIINAGDSLTPTDEDEMLIVICSEFQKELGGLLNTFHQAGVLTIVISTSPIKLPIGIYDSLTIVNHDEVVGVIRTLLNPVFFHGRLNYDFNDLAFTLRDSDRFMTLTAYAQGKKRMRDLVALLEQQLPPLESIENLSMIIQLNEKMIAPPVSIKEMSVVMDYIGILPETINVIWGMSNNEELDCHTVGLSAIASGKSLMIKR